jgi:hypothetical protein
LATPLLKEAMGCRVATIYLLIYPAYGSTLPEMAVFGDRILPIKMK